MKPIDESKLGPPLPFYNGTVTLRFLEDEWTYYLVQEDGTLVKQDGVSKITGIMDKPYLKPWAAKMMYLKMLRLMPRKDQAEGLTPRVKDITWQEFDSLLLDAKNAHAERLEDAGDVGHMAHTWIEASILNAITFNQGVVEQMNEMAPTDERAYSAGMAAHKWMVKHNVRWISTEKKIYSREYGYAGTKDGDALVDSCDDPGCCTRIFQDEYSLIDWKSSNQLSLEYLAQTAAYQHAAEEEFPNQKYDARWILRLSKEGDAKQPFEAWYERGVEEDFAFYLACLQLHRAHKTVEKRMSEQKKLKTFRKREEKKAVTAEKKEKLKFEKRLAKASKA